MTLGLTGLFMRGMFRLPERFGRLLLSLLWLMLTASPVVRFQVLGSFGLVVLRFVRFGAMPLTRWMAEMVTCIVILPLPSSGIKASAQSRLGCA